MPPSAKTLPKTARSFAVVSDGAQEDTLPFQRAWAQEAATANGWTLTREFPGPDARGVSSGRDGARRLLHELIDALDATPERPERVLMIRLDRIGRGGDFSTMAAFHEIHSRGVTIHTRQDGDVSLGRATDMLVPALRLIVAGLENDTRIDKAKAMFKRRRERAQREPNVAIGSRRPYGLQVVSGIYIAKPPELDAMKLAYEMRLEGYGFLAIAKRLREVAAPMERRDGKLMPFKWDPSTVSQMIRRESYKGTIVDEATWERAQRNMRDTFARTEGVTHEWPLTGALRCECGVPLMGLYSGGKRRTYYVCRDRDRVHGKYRCHRVTRVEQQFVALLDRLVASPELVGVIVDRGGVAEEQRGLATRVADLRREAADVTARRERVWEAFESGSLRRDTVQQRLDDLTARETEARAAIVRTEAELAAMKARAASEDEAQGLVAMARRVWDRAAVADRKALARAVSDALGGLVVTDAGELVAGGIVLGPQRRRS